MHGAATSCNADAFAFAAAQVKKANSTSRSKLGGGVNYVFWGGREGYQNLWNTDMQARSVDNLGRTIMNNAHVDYSKSDRLERAVPDRAQTQGTDQAPVRLRRGGLHQLPAAAYGLDRSGSS